MPFSSPLNERQNPAPLEQSGLNCTYHQSSAIAAESRITTDTDRGFDTLPISATGFLKRDDP